jgi:hypothetical protein
MALATTGSLSLKSASGFGRNIQLEVQGNNTGNASLSTLATTASLAKNHLAFYGYCAFTPSFSTVCWKSPTTGTSTIWTRRYCKSGTSWITWFSNFSCSLCENNVGICLVASNPSFSGGGICAVKIGSTQITQCATSMSPGVCYTFDITNICTNDHQSTGICFTGSFG